MLKLRAADQAHKLVLQKQVFAQIATSTYSGICTTQHKLLLCWQLRPYISEKRNLYPRLISLSWLSANFNWFYKTSLDYLSVV